MVFADLEKMKQEGLFRERQTLASAQGTNVKIKDKNFINFSSNDYLGFANDPSLKKHMLDSVERYGIGSGSSQLLTGHLTPHHELEVKLADFLQRDAALVFATGYQANLAVASALIDVSTVIVQDKYNHASLIDSALLSKGKLRRYTHKNVTQLQSLLEKNKDKNLVVMTDGVFSMDGDHAPLKEITSLCEKYNAMLVVDDAHGIGVLGKTGAGLLEELGLNQENVPLLIGTFGKSFGACGAFIAGPENLIETFVQKARTYIYTTALLPSVASTMVFAIDKIINGQDLRKQLKIVVSYFLEQMQEHRLPTIGNGHIQPFIVGDSKKAIELSEQLYAKGLLVNAIRPPTVPKGAARLRISITAKHTKKDIDKLINALVESC